MKPIQIGNGPEGLGGMKDRLRMRCAVVGKGVGVFIPHPPCLGARMTQSRSSAHERTSYLLTATSWLLGCDSSSVGFRINESRYPSASINVNPRNNATKTKLLKMT